MEKEKVCYWRVEDGDLGYRCDIPGNDHESVPAACMGCPGYIPMEDVPPCLDGGAAYPHHEVDSSHRCQRCGWLAVVSE